MITIMKPIEDQIEIMLDIAQGLIRNVNLAESSLKVLQERALDCSYSIIIDDLTPTFKRQREQIRKDLKTDLSNILKRYKDVT